MAGIDHEWSYLTLTVEAQRISGVVTSVDRSGKITRNRDPFSYPAASVSLPKGATAEL